MSAWRRLPAPVPPARHETIASWLHRLAAVHGLHVGDLRAHLGIGRPEPGGMPGLAARLAAVTGYPPGNLARALPELRVPEPDWLSLRDLAQRACPRCTARHQGGPVRRLFAHHEYLCARHGYWIGPPDPSRDDPPRPLAARVPGWPRRSACWAAPGGCTAGKPRSTRPPSPPASALNCGSGPCTSRCGLGGNGAWTCSCPATGGVRCSSRAQDRRCPTPAGL